MLKYTSTRISLGYVWKGCQDHRWKQGLVLGSLEIKHVHFNFLGTAECSGDGKAILH